LCFVQPRSGQGVSQVCWSAGAGCFGIKHGWFHWESWVFSWHWYGWMMFLDDINDRRMDGDIMIYMGIWMILMILMIYIYIDIWYHGIDNLTTFIPSHGMSFRMVRFSAVEPSKQKPCSGGPFWGSQGWEGNNQMKYRSYIWTIPSHINIYIHICMYICMQTYRHTDILIYIHIHIHAHTYTYIHIYIYTYTYIHVHMLDISSIWVIKQLN
jgi:hypothetical protein